MRAAALVLCVVGVLGLGARHARGDTQRIAIVLGNNAGNGDYPALHYAELDARKLSQALIELGGVGPADLYLLPGRTIDATKAVFASVSAKIAAWHTATGTRVVLIFYFSGHSDGEVLELGGDRLGFAQLRAWLAATGADVRVAIIDSCKSGALLAAKGGTPGRGFQIRLSDYLASSGEALLTSSAADEVALESQEIRGSFFTHHLVSGLRGAADLSDDGNVTLGEAYQYAFTHTVAATAATTFGPQHPAYDYRLTGEGELVLATSMKPGGRIELPAGFDRILVVQVPRNQVLAEIPQGAMRTVALLPGAYEIRAWRRGTTYAGRVDVRVGETRVLRAEELAETRFGVAGAKGTLTARDDQPTVSVALGGQRGISTHTGALLALNAAILGPGTRGWSGAVDLASGRGAGYRETSGVALGGYFVGAERGPLRVNAGLQLGGGLVIQRRDVGDTFTSPALVVAPWLSVAMRLTTRWSLCLDGRLSATWLYRDRGSALAYLPAGFLGVAARL